MKKSTLKKIIEIQKTKIEQLQNQISSYGNPCNSCSNAFDYSTLEDSLKKYGPCIGCTPRYKLVCENSENKNEYKPC